MADASEKVTLDTGGEERDPRLCTALTRRGEPCPSYVVRGRDQCAGHLGLGGLDQKLAVEKSAEVRRQRREAAKTEAQLGFRQALARQLNERKAEIMAVLLDGALEAEDRRTLLALITQAFGQPTETVVTQTDQVDLSSLSLDELRAMRDRVLAENPHLRGVPTVPPTQAQVA